MRNLITGIFALLAGTFFVGGRQLLDDNDGSLEQLKAHKDSAIVMPRHKSPEPPGLTTAN